MKMKKRPRMHAEFLGGPNFEGLLEHVKETGSSTQ